MAGPRELPVPPDAAAAGEAVELLRGWLLDGRLVCSLFPTAFEDPAVWGVLLADVAHHVANALDEASRAESRVALAAIARAFAIEMRSPTDEHTGGFIG